MVLALSEAGQRAAALGLAAAAALVVWFVVLAVLALATRPDLPPAARASSELGGRESPAVVSFLVNRWEVGPEAVPATLLDLAARGALSIDQVAPGRYVVRVRSAVPPDLADYEEQVLDHVRSLASNGVVPAEALTTGPEMQSQGWRRRFRKAVVADARRQGLSRSRWSTPILVVIGAVALAPAFLAAGAVVAAPSSDTSSKDDNPVEGVVSLGLFAWAGLMAIPFSLRAERHTAQGQEAAARWLGLREFLEGDDAFDRAPPAAVAIWDRYLAYGAAMGVAAGAVRALPLGSESDTEAWSSYGGSWHVVRVRYPSKLPPGWGQRPVVAAAKGLGALAAAVFVVVGVGRPLAGVAGDLLDRPETWALTGLAVFGVLLAALSLFVLRSALMLGFAVSDLFSKLQVEGQVIRLRNNYLALDDGQSRRVRAWRVEPMRLGPATRGAVVRVTVSPRLGHVFLVEPAGRASEAGGQRLGVDDAQVLERSRERDVEEP